MDVARFPYVLTVAITLATALILAGMGRVWVCPCGWVDLWGPVGSVEANMQLGDWYTPSHLLHGILFYAGLWAVLPRMAVGWRLVLATVLEAGWEILENTDVVIQRYRDTTISSDYIGDSVANSMADMGAMFAGFALARVVPVWVSVAVVVGFEVLTGVIIRDGLALNIIMFVWPSEAILEWQGGG